MAGTGREPLAVWREAREWWQAEPYREFTRHADGREETKEMPCLGELPGMTAEEQALQQLRDEKKTDELNASMSSLSPSRTLEEKGRERTRWHGDIRSGTNSHNVQDDGDRYGAPPVVIPRSRPAYAPLHLLSGYAFGRSTTLADDLGFYVSQGGCTAAAIADPFSLVGCSEFAKACSCNTVKPLIGASLELPEGGEIVLIAQTNRGYQNLSELITECHLDEPRGFPLATWERLERHTSDLLCLTGGDVGPLDRLLVRRDFDAAKRLVRRLIRLYGRKSVYLEVERSFLPWGTMVEERLLELADATGTTAVAGGMVTHRNRGDFPAQDALICVDSLCLIEEITGRKLRRDPSQPPVLRPPERSLNAERYLRSAEEMHALYCDNPDLLENTLRLADRCEKSVLPARTSMPRLFPNDDIEIGRIVFSEAERVYGSKYSSAHRKRLNTEIRRIRKQNSSTHFLIAWDFCRWAQDQGIGMSGRGSVIDSAVAYVLGLSRIDAIRHNLHFDRFMPGDGSKRPDIDIDFEAHRRDDVRGYMIAKYGIEHVAGISAIGTYRTRGIVREVGKVFGLSDETISFLAKRIHGGVRASRLESALEDRPELRGSNIPKERFRWVLALADRMMDIPRNIRTHSSGVIVCSRPLREIVPLIPSAALNSEESGASDASFRIVQWDKRTVKHYFDKFDILCLRGQDVMAGVESRIRAKDPDFSANRVPSVDDPEVYRAMRSGELVGIPQSASPAMRQAHMRLGTNDLHDASLVQAGIRPGVGGAVKINELIARRRRVKDFDFEHPELEEILGLTYGIVVFQEQVDQLLQTFCGYTSGQAEDIRDAVHKRRSEDFGETLREKIIDSTISRGYSPEVAGRVFEAVKGFSGYGFAQGHALAFAEVSLRCVWMMQNHPAEYFASLLSAQPAGYYGPATIANEARTRGVRILPLDVNRSRERFEVETVTEGGLAVPAGGIRTALPQLSGLSAPTMARIYEHQELAFPAGQRARRTLSSVHSGVAVLESAGESSSGLQAFGSLFDFVRKARPSRDELEALILVGALDSFCGNRRALLWAVPTALAFAKSCEPKGLHPELPFDMEEPPLDLTPADFSLEERAVYERKLLGLDVERHLMAYERERVASKGGKTTAEVRRLPAGAKTIVVGNPIRLRFPPTQSGKRVLFFDLEDETGLLNVTCFDDTYQRYGAAIVCSQYITLIGVLQDRDGTPAFLASHAYVYRPMLMRGTAEALPVGVADFLVG